MKRSKFTDEQILAIGKVGEADWKVADLCRADGIAENRCLKHIIAEQTLDIQALKAVAQNSVGPIARREAAGACESTPLAVIAAERHDIAVPPVAVMTQPAQYLPGCTQMKRANLA